MLSIEDIIKIRLSEEQMKLCAEHSEKCSLGGISRIRKGDDRKRFLFEDQLVGQTCTCALAIWIYGQEGVRIYDKIRTEKNKYPEEGDDGRDLPPFPIDIKGSKVRNLCKPVLTYNLAVRSRERHQNWNYVLALAIPPRIMLVGWISDTNLPERVAADGVFKGAYCVVASELNPMKSLNLKYFKNET